MSAITLTGRPAGLRSGKSSPGVRGENVTPALPDDVCLDGVDVDGCVYCTGPETD